MRHVPYDDETVGAKFTRLLSLPVASAKPEPAGCLPLATTVMPLDTSDIDVCH